jgi:hypothetical protein
MNILVLYLLIQVAYKLDSRFFNGAWTSGSPPLAVGQIYKIRFCLFLSVFKCDVLAVADISYEPSKALASGCS